MRIVLDTNVLVSGLLNPHNPPGRIVDLVLGGQIVLLVDDRILLEYRSVLVRPAFGFDPGNVTDLVNFIERESVPALADPSTIRLPDPSDLPFLEVALSGGAQSFVTGNVKHFPERRTARTSVRIEAPATFLQRWSRERPNDPGTSEGEP